MNLRGTLSEQAIFISRLEFLFGINPHKGDTDTETTISEVTMVFDLGFRIDETAMTDTIDAARK